MFDGFTFRYGHDAFPTAWVARDPGVVRDHARDPFNNFGAPMSVRFIRGFVDLYDAVNADTWPDLVVALDLRGRRRRVALALVAVLGSVLAGAVAVEARPVVDLLDPDRAELVRFAFTAYATGNWSLSKLARELEAEGRSAKDAAIEAARLRLRPILMTSLAFIMGVLPLVLSTGAGAEMRSAMGIAVFAGMIGVTLIGLFLTPVFYVLVRRLAPTRRQAMPAAAPLTGESVPS